MACSKVKYHSQGAALKAADAQRSRKGVLRSYLCFDCMAWHLTSMPPKQYLKRFKR